MSVTILGAASPNTPDGSVIGQIRIQKVQTVKDMNDLEGNFDGIVCSSVIGHVSLPEWVLAHLRPELRQYGISVNFVVYMYSIIRAS